MCSALAAVEEVAFTGRVVYIGYGKAPVEYETRLFVQKELTIRGSRNCIREVDFPEVMAHLEGGDFPVDEVVSRRVSLDEASAAMEDWNADPGAICKMMLDLSE